MTDVTYPKHHPPRTQDYEHLESSSDLAEFFIGYGEAYTQHALDTSKPTNRVIYVSSGTAFQLSFFKFIHLLGGGATRHIWTFDYAMWLGVDEDGNLFEYGSEGYATHLSRERLRRMSPSELKQLIRSCNPFEHAE